MMNGMYKVQILDCCEKCGICCELCPGFFFENEKGEVSVKQELVAENEIKDIYGAVSLCLTDAIKVEPADDYRGMSKGEAIGKIKVIINSELNNIEVPQLQRKDFFVGNDNVSMNSSFSSVWSDYKYSTYEKAEEYGVIELNKIVNEHEKATVQSALVDYKVKVLDKFYNKDNKNYFFKDIEFKLNKAIDEITYLMTNVLGVNIEVNRFNIDFSKMWRYQVLNEFETMGYPLFLNRTIGAKYYVEVEYADYKDKYQYMLKADSIKDCFKSMVDDMYSDYAEKDAEVYLRDVLDEYKTALFEYINNVRTKMMDLIEMLSKKLNISSNATVNKESIKTVLNEYSAMKYDEVKVMTGTIDGYYDSDYRFASHGAASKAGQNRADRMEREAKDELQKYSYRLAEVLSDVYIKDLENLMVEIQNIYALDNVKVPEKNINLQLDNSLTVEVSLKEGKVSNDMRRKIYSECEDVCKRAMRNEGTTFFIWPDVDSMEVYLGDGLFGRMKFGTRYNYNLDVYKFRTELDEKYKAINKRAVKEILPLFMKNTKKSLEEYLLK